MAGAMQEYKFECTKLSSGRSNCVYERTHMAKGPEGADIKGFFVWSFLDNFEWAEASCKARLIDVTNSLPVHCHMLCFYGVPAVDPDSRILNFLPIMFCLL
eukprot:4813029-Amphidinium_carterae.1